MSSGLVAHAGIGGQHEVEQRLGHALLPPAGHRARMGDLGDPAGQLRVEIRHRAERARGKERVTEEADHSFHTAFFIPAGHRARLGGEVVMAGEFEHVRMEADVIADALEDHALQIVVQDGAGHALEGGEGLDVPRQETLERLVEGEAGGAGARPGEHEHEAREEAGGGADADRPEVPPVDLGLLAGEGLEAQEGLGTSGGALAPRLLGSSFLSTTKFRSRPKFLGVFSSFIRSPGITEITAFQRESECS